MAPALADPTEPERGSVVGRIARATVTLDPGESIEDLPGATKPAVYTSDALTLVTVVHGGSGARPPDYELVQEIADGVLHKPHGWMEADRLSPEETENAVRWEEPAVPPAARADVVNRSGGTVTYKLGLLTLLPSGEPTISGNESFPNYDVIPAEYRPPYGSEAV